MIPAIDLRRGRVVRLEQGDFERETAFAADPAETARRFAEAGARWIHVVDLDGAREGRPRQATTIASIVEAAPGTRVEVAGGLRDGPSIEAALGTGAGRVVLGTIAITDPEVVAAAIERHGPERIAVALDIRGGRAVGGGWLGGAPQRDARRLIDEVGTLGVETIIVTAIERDGLLGGPDVALLRACVRATSANVIASGGVASIDDLREARAIGCAGAIVGRALYDGRLDLAAAIRALAAVSLAP